MTARPETAAPADDRHTVPLADGRATSAIVYPSTGASDRPAPLLVLAHGAGAGQTHPFMRDVAGRLATEGIEVVTFDFPYVHEGRKIPDRAPVLEACFAAVITWAVSRGTEPRGRLFIGGKSMGGRMATHLAAQSSAGPTAPFGGVVALGYPLHPPGKPTQLRVAHLPAIDAPVLMVQGSRDAFGSPAELAPIIETMHAPVTLHVVEGGDHSFAVSHVPKADVMSTLVTVVASWIHARA